MQLGRAIIGAVIGAAIGIAVLVAVYLALQIDSVWLALAVAVLTGLGVRMMVTTGGHASYLRGAITGAMALGAYLLGWYLVAMLAQQNAAKASQPTPTARSAEADADEKADDNEAKGDEPADDADEAPKARPATGIARRDAPTPKMWSGWDFVLLCVSALIAYELGRGTAAAPATVASDEPPGDIPQGTHPDA
jgi:hypothetical protein